jgi:signal transduction histidine kinase
MKILIVEDDKALRESITADSYDFIKKDLKSIEELLEVKEVTIKMQLDEPFIVGINPVLAEILVHNLLSNAVKYNVAQGNITIISENTYPIFLQNYVLTLI